MFLEKNFYFFWLLIFPQISANFTDIILGEITVLIEQLMERQAIKKKSLKWQIKSPPPSREWKFKAF
jgi:hypothetical protein